MEDAKARYKELYGDELVFEAYGKKMMVIGTTFNGEKILCSFVDEPHRQPTDYWVEPGWKVKPKYPLTLKGDDMLKVLDSLGGCSSIYQNNLSKGLQFEKLRVMHIVDRGPGGTSGLGRYELHLDCGTWLGEKQIGPGACDDEYLFDKPHSLTDIEKKIILKEHGSLIIDCAGIMLNVIGIGYKSSYREYHREAYATDNCCYSSFENVDEAGTEGSSHHWHVVPPMIESKTFDDPDYYPCRAVIDGMIKRFKGKNTEITFKEVK
jgi:hypothetical protein